MVQNGDLEDYLFGLDPGRRGRMRKVEKPTAIIVVRGQGGCRCKAIQVRPGNPIASSKETQFRIHQSVKLQRSLSPGRQN